MKKQSIRVMATIVVILAVSIQVQAQLGGAVNRARNAAQQTVRNATEQATQATGNNAAGNIISNSVATATLSSEQRTAIAKLQDESQRNAPKVKELSDYQRDFDLIRDWFGKAAMKPVGLVQTRESAQAFKAAIEARTAENREIFCALFQVPANYDCSKLTDDYDFSFMGNSPNIKDEVRAVSDAVVSAGEELRKELENYQVVLALAADLVPRGKIEGDIQTGATITIDDLRAGLFRVGSKDGKFVFYNRAGQVAPCDEDQFVRECKKLDIVQILLKNEGSEKQSDQYWLALASLHRFNEAQRNSKGMEEKVPVPSPSMNDAALTAKMLRLAQGRYSDMGIVQVVIIEPAWRPVRNALGVIIHRTINTSMIYPKGGGYAMTTLSFIEPYTGNGNYGETQAHGIGIDLVAVDYK